jgi:heme-degrading monooxygenase HmoA
MIAVIFEVEPKSEQSQNYFDQAKTLKAYLQNVPGFISIERFKSLTNNSKYLSLSFFENEASVKQWRNQFMHQKAQARGKDQIFDHYRIRVASVIRDYGMQDRTQAPNDTNGVQ